jgi:hypothetical protein
MRLSSRPDVHGDGGPERRARTNPTRFDVRSTFELPPDSTVYGDEAGPKPRRTRNP